MFSNKLNQDETHWPQKSYDLYQLKCSSVSRLSNSFQIMCHLTFLTSVQIFDLLCRGLKDCSSWIFIVIFIQQCPGTSTRIRILLFWVFLNVQEKEMGQVKLTMKWVGNIIGLVQMRELGSLPRVHAKFETPFHLVKWSGVGKPASSFKESYSLTQKA